MLKGYLLRDLIRLPSLAFRKYLLDYQKIVFYECDTMHPPQTKPKLRLCIRQAKIEDMEKLVEMRTRWRMEGESIIKKRRYLRQVFERLKAGHWCFIAESVHSEEILGYLWVASRELYVCEIEMTMKFNENEAMFYDVYTFPPYRRKGVAQKIYEEVINLLRIRNFKKLYVAVLQHNKPSKALAKKLNFKPVKTTAFLKILGIKTTYTDEIRSSNYAHM